MATIIASRFQLKEQAELVVEQLIQVGFAAGKVTSFYVNPAGQHDAYPIGGDRYQSPGMTQFGKNFAVVEAVIGVSAPKENHMGNHPYQRTGQASSEHATVADNSVHPDDITPIRKAGMLVAVELEDQNFQDRAISFLKRLGAENIEKLEGEIIEGEWHDFDPLSEPSYL
ncbi:hypothetical protein [Solimicrobium silvestre]|uniref:Uncharacterized protein n=1 Tax=Solimicrobium silvestre TaxID=2099400 RepID=A0A2S9GXK8_9BURK|nr:hypothetical protein [Solimicrobium silvestre]PRC92449.1 hypothetical protein S2091_2824 [Solimicrobium silvestre]